MVRYACHIRITHRAWEEGVGLAVSWVLVVSNDNFEILSIRVMQATNNKPDSWRF